MKTAKILAILVVALGLMLWQVEVNEAGPIDTAWTYQGRLMDANKPADGLYDFQFRLFDANAAGTQQGNTVDVNDVDVIDGYFTVELNFGSDVFDGDARWLETTVARTDGSDPCTLRPRQEVMPVPYALQTRGIFVDNAGYVGIGTTAPIQKLDVAGNIAVSGTVDGVGLSDHAAGATAHHTPPTTLPPSGPAGGDLSGTYPNPSVVSDSHTHGNGTVSDNISINNGRLYAPSGSGNVGIGTISPTQKLDVAGNVRASRYYDRDGAGYYLDPYGSSYLGVVYAINFYSNGFYDRQDPNFFVDPASSGTSTAGNFAGNVYASRYYGRNNINFYVDPDGTSYCNDMRVGILYDRDNTGYYVNPADTGTSAYFAGNVYASRYYDRNNSGYYVDPDSTSNLYNLEVQEAVHMPAVYYYSHGLSGREVRIVSSGRLGTVGSSRRYKENIAPLEDDFSKILLAQPVAFNWKKTKEPDIGLIAEDMDELGLRNLVFYDAEGRPDAVRYDFVSLYLLEVLKDQANSIKELKAENELLKEQLKSENQSLKQRLGALERTVQQIVKAKEVKL